MRIPNGYTMEPGPGFTRMVKKQSSNDSFEHGMPILCSSYEDFWQGDCVLNFVIELYKLQGVSLSKESLYMYYSRESKAMCVVKSAREGCVRLAKLTFRQITTTMPGEEEE